MYDLITSVSVICLLKGGTIDPPRINCIQQLRIGNSEPVVTNKTLVYRTSASSTEIPYTGQVTINRAWKWIEFRLYEETTLLDAERVPILIDGEDSFVVDLHSESLAIPCDEYGDPKQEAFPIQNRAVFYAGITAADAEWTLVNAPPGVSINSSGVINIVFNYAYEDINQIIVRGTYNDIVRESVMTITKVLDGVAPVVINISPDSETIAYDHNGVPHPGQLPFTMKATLYKGTLEVNGVTWWQRLTQKQLILFPGSGAEIFNPLAGGNFPANTQVITWSLTGAPNGVTIDDNGVITVSLQAELAEKNKITVNAVFEGETYSKAFTINTIRDGDKGEQGDEAPKYLGKTYSMGTLTGVVYLYKGQGVSAQEYQAHKDDWVIFAGITSSSGWTNGRVYQWNGVRWIPITPPTAQERQNAVMYMMASTDITEGAPSHIFSFAQIRSLVTEAIFTELLGAGEIELNDDYGRGGGVIKSSNFSEANNTGWMIDFLGNAIFNNIRARGHIEATSGRFRGSVEMGIPTTIHAGVLPLLGGIRAWVYGYKYGSTIDWSIKSSNILAVTKIDTGKYEIKMQDIYTNSGLGFSAQGWGSHGYDTNYDLWYRNPVGIELSNVYWASRAGAGSGYFIGVEFKNNGGTLIDPQVINILFLS